MQLLQSVYTLYTDSDDNCVNDNTMLSFTEECVPLVNMSTIWNGGRSGYPTGSVNSLFRACRKSKYDCARFLLLTVDDHVPHV